MGNLGIASLTYPLELFVSYARQVLLVSPIILIALWVWRKYIWTRLFWILPILIALAFWPLADPRPYKSAQNIDCAQQHCLRIYSANLQGTQSAIDAAANQSNAYDIIGLYEVDPAINLQDISRKFPNHPYIHLLARDPQQNRGRSIALISHYEFTSSAVSLPVTRYFRTYNQTSIIHAKMNLPNHPPLDIIALHPAPPLDSHAAKSRNTIFAETTNRLSNNSRFIILGDFNSVPWSAAFKKIPGRRAGDVRLAHSWPSYNKALSLIIDHIKLGDDIALVHSQVEPDSHGSDHFPISAIIAPQ